MTTPLKSMATKVWNVRSNVAQADVYSTGGALHNLCFTLADGRQVFPLAEAHWQETFLNKTGSEHARHIELLGGEWSCVPFGSSDLDPSHHGFGSDNQWELVHRDDHHVSVSIDYPKGHAIKRLCRKITLPLDENYVEISLSVTASRDAIVPIGMHPILAIPPTDAWTLVPGRHEKATTSVRPSVVNSGSIRPGAQICAMGQVDICGQDRADLWNNPSIFTDALIQLWKTQGRFELCDQEADTVTWVEWNEDDLPHCLLWFANPGLSLGDETAGFKGLGVEPIHANFDGREDEESTSHGVKLSAGKTWQTTYRIGCRSLQDT